MLADILDEVVILPTRLSLRTPHVFATVPMIRGVWGSALYKVNHKAYLEVFEGEGKQNQKTPLYILRPAPPDPQDSPAIEWIVIGKGLNYYDKLLKAWEVACDMGLGSNRYKFEITKRTILSPSGKALPSHIELSGWLLGSARLPFEADLRKFPCRLSFPFPLRLLRQGKLIEKPSLADITVACIRRISSFVGESAQARLGVMKPKLLEIAREIPTTGWEGERLDLIRYSGRQKVELEMRGVSGYIDLPEGAGDLLPLLSSAQWIHIGKGTIVGMGMLSITPLDA